MQTATMSGWAVSSRDVVIAADVLGAGQLPQISVKSGRPADAWLPVTYRPRLLVRRGALWALVGSMDLGGCLFVLVALPVTFALHPLTRWINYLFPHDSQVRGVLPVTAAEAERIPLVRNAATVVALVALALFAALLIGAPVGWLLAIAVVCCAILGGIDYFSLPVGKPATVDGRRVVMLHGVHPEFATALDAMRPSGQLPPAIPRQLGRNGRLLLIAAATGGVVAVNGGVAIYGGLHSSQLEAGWPSSGPCTVRLSSHDMNATVYGPGAKKICTGWLKDGNAADPSGNEMCTETTGDVSIVVHDSGGMSYGAGLCDALDQWIKSGGAVPSLYSPFTWTDLPTDLPTPSSSS